MHDLPSEMKTSPPKISIGLVVYNGVEHIRSALDSIVRQSYKNIELIVVDGGSTDGTQDVLNEYAEHISVLVSEPDKGIYDAMNKVCSLATGDWLIFLGCDDVLLDALGKVAEQMTDYETLYYGDAIFSSIGDVYGGEFSKIRLMRQNICHQAMFYPKPVYKKYSYSLEYRWMADYVYNLKLIGDSVPFVYVGAVVSIYNDKGGSSLGDAVVEKKIFSLLRATFGTKYALFGVLLRRMDKIYRDMVVVVKYLLPYSVWKYIRSFWRRLKKIF